MPSKKVSSWTCLLCPCHGCLAHGGAGGRGGEGFVAGLVTGVWLLWGCCAVSTFWLLLLGCCRVGRVAM